MSKRKEERCDCCDRIVWQTGFKGYGVERIYRRKVRKSRWVFGVRHWLSWSQVDEGWQTICGDCWNTVGRFVREKHCRQEAA